MTIHLTVAGYVAPHNPHCRRVVKTSLAYWRERYPDADFDVDYVDKLIKGNPDFIVLEVRGQPGKPVRLELEVNYEANPVACA